MLCPLIPKILKFCTDISCPTMTTKQYFLFILIRGEFAWKNEETEVVELLPANEYVNNLMIYVKHKLDDEKICPVNGKLPDNFIGLCNEIVRRLVRLFHHFYDNHCKEMIDNNIYDEFLDCYREFYLFSLRNNLSLIGNPSSIVFFLILI